MVDNDSHINLAESYFDYLAQRFPVMCASDEFHFLPRAVSSGNYYDRLDNLDSAAVKETIDHLKGFLNDFSKISDRKVDLEDFIDLQLLQANITGILIELERKRSWQYNPLLYLKIAFIGLDHALTKPASGRGERIDRTIARLSAIPRLMKQISDNISIVPETYYHASRSMLADCQQYLGVIGSYLLEISAGKQAEMLSACLSNASTALAALNRFLASFSPEPDRRFAVETLQTTMQDHFLTVRSVDNVYQMALEDWEINLSKLEKLKSKINPGATWQELYHAYFPPDIDKDDTKSLYSCEIERLRLFFRQQGFRFADLHRPVEITDTPIYLRSVRGAASFAAALTPDEREESYFFITVDLPPRQTDQSDTLLKKRLHREFKMLTAHETIPGHHLLDSIRRRLINPIRRQIESPLFYEGWASYAEFLLVDSGYIDDPMDLLVDYKRRLWRSARCQVDVGLTTGKIKLDEAIGLLNVCGFSPDEALRQVDRFRLNPGYQLCYSLGCHEFKQMKANFGSRMEDAKFHPFLLEGGELPFHFIEKRFEALLSNNSE